MGCCAPRFRTCHTNRGSSSPRRQPQRPLRPPARLAAPLGVLPACGFPPRPLCLGLPRIRQGGKNTTRTCTKEEAQHANRSNWPWEEKYGLCNECVKDNPASARHWPGAALPSFGRTAAQVEGCPKNPKRFGAGGGKARDEGAQSAVLAAIAGLQAQQQAQFASPGFLQQQAVPCTPPRRMAQGSPPGDAVAPPVGRRPGPVPAVGDAAAGLRPAGLRRAADEPRPGLRPCAGHFRGAAPRVR